MNNRKSYNSIVFLTTLSVYLGLVLVGGSPSVLAHSALTRQFDIKHEIEIEDDLDNKPDDEKILTDYAVVYEQFFKIAEEFVAKNPDYLQDGRYDFTYSVFLKKGLSLAASCPSRACHFWGGFSPTVKNLSQTFPFTPDEKAEKFKVSLSLTETEFALNTQFNQDSESQAEQFSTFYTSALSKLKFETKNELSALIYQNTEILSDTNRILVVTRLPRASIKKLTAETDVR